MRSSLTLNGLAVRFCSVVQSAWIGHACSLPVLHHVPTLGEHMQVPTAFKTIQIQPCSVGHVTDEYNTSCTVCGNSTFSLDPNKTFCDACPSPAQCFGNDVFIPPEQHWHSSPNSTTILSCPNPGACGGNRTHLLNCKLVSANYTTMHSAFDTCHGSFACCLEQVHVT